MAADLADSPVRVNLLPGEASAPACCLAPRQRPSCAAAA